MLATQAPYSQYFDKNGDPLDAGFVYFGSPNQNPETAPITVYWDIDGTQPVAQPARTLAGYIVRNGTPARVYAEGAYSVTVRNRKGEMVYYAPTSTDFSDLPVNRAVVTATNGQTLVNLPFAYTRGNNSLQLFVNGMIVRGNGVDYTETTTTSVTFPGGLSAGDEVEALGGALLNPANALGMVSDVALAASTGSALVGDNIPVVPYLQTISQILQGERVSLFRFMIDGASAGAQTLIDNFRTGTVTTDYGPQIQSAFDAANTNAYELYIPKVKNYIRSAQTILVRYPLSVSGAGCVPYGFSGPYVDNARGHGSWIYFDHAGIGFDIGNASGSMSGMSFDGIGTIRNQPISSPGWVPTANLFDFDIDNCDAKLTNLMLYNPSRGIKLNNGSFGRLTIDNVRGQPLIQGLEITESYDTVRVNGLHWWPFWRDTNDIRAYTFQNLVGIALYRCDNPKFSNCFGIFANKGLAFGQNAAGLTSKFKGVNLDFDRGKYGVTFENTLTGECTAQFENLSVQGETGLANTVGVQFDSTGAIVQFGNTRITETEANSLRVNGTGNRLVFGGNLRVDSWNRSGAGFPAIEVATGNSVKMATTPISYSAFSTAVYGGAGTINCPLGQGVSTANTNASSDVVVAHNFNAVPTGVNVQLRSTSSLNLVTHSFTSTTFSVRVYVSSTGVGIGAGVPIDFSWEAYR